MEYNFYVDRKSTIWDREYYTVEAESEEEALEKILYDGVDSYDHETLYDSQEYIEPEENNGESTLEAYDGENDTLIYTNSNVSDC